VGGAGIMGIGAKILHPGGESEEEKESRFILLRFKIGKGCGSKKVRTIIL